MSDSPIELGSIVVYAGAPYIVVSQNADLLTLDGVADNVTVSSFDGDGSGTARPRCTVLATDITACPDRPSAPHRATEQPEVVSETGGSL